MSGSFYKCSPSRDYAWVHDVLGNFVCIASGELVATIVPRGSEPWRVILHLEQPPIIDREFESPQRAMKYAQAMLIAHAMTRKIRNQRASRQPSQLVSETIVSAYIAGLKAAVERDRTRKDEQERAVAAQATQAARERLTPLEDRLARLLATVPIEMQREGLPLSSLQTALRGRWRGNVHPGELGTALRRLGFDRHRNWRGADGFRAVWRKRS